MRAVMSAMVLALVGCSIVQPVPAPVASVAAAAAAPGVVRQDSAADVETIPFHTGVSSATVEKLARAQGCTGGPGAALVTAPGPVEIYRMRCDGNQVFMARCELRQCKRM